TEQASRIHRIPKTLCVRGTPQIDTTEQETAALARAAERGSILAEVHPGCVPNTWRFKRTQPATGKVSIIIPTCAAHGNIGTCIRTIRDHTSYSNFEIVVIDNIPDSQIAWKTWVEHNAEHVVPIADAFNWSRFNNRGAAAATGEYLLFLNDDIEIGQPD